MTDNLADADTALFNQDILKLGKIYAEQVICHQFSNYKHSSKYFILYYEMRINILLTKMP
jgi:hypothetical protein